MLINFEQLKAEISLRLWCWASGQTGGCTWASVDHRSWAYHHSCGTVNWAVHHTIARFQWDTSIGSNLVSSCGINLSSTSLLCLSTMSWTESLGSFCGWLLTEWWWWTSTRG